MSKLSKLQTLSIIVLTGFLVAMGFDYTCSSYWGIPVYPRCTFLGRPDDAWSDLLWLAEFNKNLDPFHNTFRTWGLNYPPFAHLLMVPFTNLVRWPWPVPLYLAGTAAGVLAFVAWACRTTRDEDPAGFGWVAALIIGAASYPFLFAMDRLNVENLIFLLVALGFWAEVSHIRGWSPVLWGSACAAKIYPGLFAFLYVVERRWKDLSVLVGVALGWTIVSMAVFGVGPAEAWASYARSVPNQEAMTVWFTNVQHSSSFFAIMRLFHAWRYGIDPAFRNMTFAQVSSSYLWMAGVLLFVLLTSALKKSTLRTWERMFLITSTILVVPPTSFDYKLLYLFVPLAGFINDDRIERRAAACYCIGFGLLLIPKHYYVFFEDVSISVVLNPLILLAMSFPLAATAWFPEARALFQGRRVALTAAQDGKARAPR